MPRVASHATQGLILEQDVLQGYRKRYGRLFKRGHKGEREKREREKRVREEEGKKKR